ncbi:MAG: MBL fold metallo-hydrolase [Bacteroidaceae bacterium]|nr:MBL fold metallo-hydrolase [Bacteroidaceae bacterium]
MSAFADSILNAQAGSTHLLYAGQAGFIIKSRSGETLAIDLYLSECGERIEGHIGFKRLLPQILNPGDFVFDYIIATHPHFDHYDMDSMPLLMDNGHTELFASVECSRFVDETGIDINRVFYVKPDETFHAGDFTLHFTNCDHGTLAPDAVGVIIEVDNKRIMIAGDTCLRLDRKEEYLSKGDIDILIAPINGAYGNLNEDDCVELAKVLQPRLVIPCHYGMFATHKGLPGLFMEMMANKYPQGHYTLMTMGEAMSI